MDSSLCKGACQKMNFHELLFNGLLFIFIDINAGPVDIIPDIFGYLMILKAFMKVAARYAKVGIATTIILLVANVINLFYPLQYLQLFKIEILPYSFLHQMIGLVLGIALIINYACMFAVSNTLIPITETFLPKFLITLLIVYELLVSFIYFFPVNEITFIIIPLGLLIFFTHIAFFLFLWRRGKMESSKHDTSIETPN